MVSKVLTVRTNLTISETAGAYADAITSKYSQSWWKFLGAGICGGMVVGGYGHCGLIGSSRLTFLDPKVNPTDPDIINARSYGTGLLAFACFFPGAFMSIIATGADLYTSNCMASWFHLSRGPLEWKRWWQCTYVLFLSWIGNFIGAFFGAGLIFGVGSEYFSLPAADHADEANLTRVFMCKVASGKVHYTHNWMAIIANAVLANFFVCLASMGFKQSLTTSGLYMGVIWPVANFSFGSGQHAIANQYLVGIGVWEGCVSHYDFWINNMIPCTIGNTIGGLILGCLVWMGNPSIHDKDLHYGLGSEVVQTQIVPTPKNAEVSYSSAASASSASEEAHDKLTVD